MTVAHFARTSDLRLSALTGIPVLSLCGTVFLPEHDPSLFPVCDACERKLHLLAAASSN